ncbi:hypothetical protein L3Q82_016768 [Scortum barcoo]|uniref:Uncharacterized protein n=1 Tax=Scortum barcoo TaxID=214431 RepID=A0ACB8X8P5_9TELE|nr:hypothetical protein L3Q82_016768 [Scortum barcoo]
MGHTLLRVLELYYKAQPVLTVSPSWLSPGDSVTLSCSVKDPSAGWRFFWYKAVPKLPGRDYSYELLPDSINGTEQDSYIVHGQTHTAGYVCRAGRGDPVYYTHYSKSKFVWSGDGDVILVSPVLPVSEGDSVTLGCKLRTENVLSNVDFYKNDKLIQKDTRGELNISAVSKSDEGFYKCRYSRKDVTTELDVTSNPDSSPFPVLLIVGLVCGALLIILLLLFLYRYKKSKGWFDTLFSHSDITALHYMSLI